MSRKESFVKIRPQVVLDFCFAEEDYLDDMPKDILTELWANNGPYNLDWREKFHNAYDCRVDNKGEGWRCRLYKGLLMHLY